MKEYNIPKYRIGDVVNVLDISGKICNAKIVGIDRMDGEYDYLCTPLNPADDLCGCKGQDCGTKSSWYLERHIK